MNTSPASLASRAILPGGGEAAAPPPVPERLAGNPNLLLVMVDTLRADHLSCYGSERVATPNLCRLAGDGGSVLFSGDSAWTDAFITQSQDTDLFLCECCSMERVIEVHTSYEDILARFIFDIVPELRSEG